MQFNRQQFKGCLLTTLFVFYFSGANFFTHTHVDENNRLVVHSHPFSSESHHQHSTVNFQAIDRLQNFTVCLLLFAASVIAIYKIIFILSYPYRKGFQLTAFTPFCYSRPPPTA